MSTKNANSFELEFIIIGVKINVEFEEGYFDEEEKRNILDFLESMSNSIPIDKTYVECKMNRRNSTFMLEEGWDSLRDTLIDSEYGKYLHPKSHESLIEAFAMMARCYLYECLGSIRSENDLSHIDITIKDKPFDIIICKDKSNDWKNYVGRWQDWEFDENGYYVKTKSRSK